MSRHLILKLTLLITLFSCGVRAYVKADTLDYWHVKYNGKLIRKYNKTVDNNSGRVISINSKTVKTSDRITVNYGRDTPCHDCTTELLLETYTKKQFTIVSGKGTLNPLSFSVVDVKKWGGKSFDVFYREKGRRDILLFSIKFT